MRCFFAFIGFFFLFAGPVEGVIVDNGDTNTTQTGEWAVSSKPNFYGTDSLYSNTDSTYSFHTSVAGRHTVSLWWTSSKRRAVKVPVEIYDGDTLLNVVYVDQRENGGCWNDLGVYIFTQMAKVKIISEQGEQYTSADAVRFTALLEGSVVLSWEHPSHPQLAGFEVMANNIITDIPGPELREWFGVVLLNVGQNVFKMRAYTTDGEYSEWSEPAYYTLYDVIEAPHNIKIEVIVTIVVVS